MHCNVIRGLAPQVQRVAVPYLFHMEQSHTPFLHHTSRINLPGLFLACAVIVPL